MRRLSKNPSKLNNKLLTVVVRFNQLKSGKLKSKSTRETALGAAMTCLQSAWLLKTNATKRETERTNRRKTKLKMLSRW